MKAEREESDAERGCTENGSVCMFVRVPQEESAEGTANADVAAEVKAAAGFSDGVPLKVFAVALSYQMIEAAAAAQVGCCLAVPCQCRCLLPCLSAAAPDAAPALCRRTVPRGTIVTVQ